MLGLSKFAWFAALSLLVLTSSALAACGDGKAGTGGGGSSTTTPEPEPIPLGLNDVSVLFPLPSSHEDPGYLRPADVGARGELLPRDVYDQIPTFPVVPSEGLLYARMRVVSLRFDGCSGGPGHCEPEIRLVMQPINADGSPRDSALHLFYRLDQASMTQVVDGLRALRALAPEAAVDAPLDVHPALVAQGVQGAYGTELRNLVLQHVGEENLVRMTFFLRAPPVNEVWFFGGFEREAGVLRPMDIVAVGEGNNQRVILTKTATSYDYDLTPIGIQPEDGRVFYSSAAAEAATPEQREAAMASYLRVENPKTYVPDQLPCAGCHIAGFVTAEASRKHGLDMASYTNELHAQPHAARWRGEQSLLAARLRLVRARADDRAAHDQRVCRGGRRSRGALPAARRVGQRALRGLAAARYARSPCAHFASTSSSVPPVYASTSCPTRRQARARSCSACTRPRSTFPRCCSPTASTSSSPRRRSFRGARPPAP
jgi:hypothetical protein